MNNEQKAHSLPSASLEQNGLLSAALSVEEGNKLIAEFMGRNKAFDPRDKIYQYHSSWDWLMPVVEKIERMGYDSRINTHDSESSHFVDFVDIENNEAACVIKDYHEATKIQTVWLAVVEFIQWHNKNTASVGSR